MRKKLLLLLIFCQFSVLTFMAGKREYILAYGQQIYLRTAPIDPRDPFRGDFVRLQYDLSSVNPKYFRGSVEQHRNEKDHPLYAVLKNDRGDIHTLDYLTDEKPGQGFFIKGFLTQDWRFNRWNSFGIGVRYGIEQYFVEQGKGLEMEKILGQRNELQIPLEMLIAVGSDGTALIKDYRWSKLGIKTEILRFNRRTFNNQTGQNEAENAPLSPKIKITLKNVSTGSLILADPGKHCGFILTAVDWATKDYQQADRSCDAIELDETALIVLQPDQEYAVEFELSEPRWHVAGEGQIFEVGALTIPEMFRLVYRSPDPKQIEKLAQGHNVWFGELPGQAFNAFGQID